jgi:hypothetical protein
MLRYHHQNAGHMHDIKATNRSFEDVAQFQRFGNTSSKSKFDSRKIRDD